jgi:hypothetical protein
VYSVEWEQHALDQLAALPSEAFPLYAELVALLEAERVIHDLASLV